MTPYLLSGGEGICLGREQKSDMGLASRYKTDTVVR